MSFATPNNSPVVSTPGLTTGAGLGDDEFVGSAAGAHSIGENTLRLPGGRALTAAYVYDIGAVGQSTMMFLTARFHGFTPKACLLSLMFPPSSR
jgi:hypothetical protein